jgi:prepilin-type N-terminal cleavage/methylation domain-containing protein
MLKAQKGFTLIELAIVMVIVGLLIGAGVSLLPGLINQQKYSQNQSLLNQNYNAIIGFIIKNGRAPFASTNATNSAESTNTANGYLPYVTVGGLQQDAYGNTFYYAVNTQLAKTTSRVDFCNKLLSITSSNVNTINFPGQSQTQSIPSIFILISSGENGKLDSPNSIATSNTIFASEQYPLSQNYDDMVKSLSIQQAISLFCQNVNTTNGTSTTSGTNGTGTNNSCTSCMQSCQQYSSYGYCRTQVCNKYCQ